MLVPGVVQSKGGVGVKDMVAVGVRRPAKCVLSDTTFKEIGLTLKGYHVHSWKCGLDTK